MATSNFHNAEASRIFATELEDEFSYDDLKLNLRSEFANKENDKKSVIADCYEENKSPASELRSFPATTICRVHSEDKCYAFGNINLRFDIIVRSGYYQGANLDYEMYVETDNEDYESITDLIEDIQRYPEDFDISEGMSEKYAKWIENWFKKEVEPMKEEIEKVFADYTTPLCVTARFSNGETMYAEC